MRLASVWQAIGRQLAGVWQVFGRHLAAFRRRLASIRQALDICLEGVWQAFGIDLSFSMHFTLVHFLCFEYILYSLIYEINKFDNLFMI